MRYADNREVAIEKGFEMNVPEKLGLMFFIMGMGMMTGLFVLGGGDSNNAFYEGKHISIAIPMIFFSGGAFMFLFFGLFKK